MHSTCPQESRSWATCTMRTKTSATHVHSEIHRVGGDIGSVVRDFFGCVSYPVFIMINSVENDTILLEMIIFNLIFEFMTHNNWVSNQEKSLLFFLMLHLDQIAIEPLNFKTIYKTVLGF
jgi:hypothetical protein